MRGYLYNDNPDSSRNFALFGGGVTAVLSIAGMVLLGVLLPEPALNFTGFVFGGAGLVVSLAGFSFTIWQLRRTERATDAATAALDRARKEAGSSLATAPHSNAGWAILSWRLARQRAGWLFAEYRPGLLLRFTSNGSTGDQSYQHTQGMPLPQ